jgi:prepilin-type N-terminal cleavage/methylation domain-containing protein
MKIGHTRGQTLATTSATRGFTLIEMVGVLAVIAILAALLVPKIFAAINDSRYSSTVSTLNNCKTATLSYFGKYGQFTNASAFDTVLVTSDFLERPFAAKLGSGSKMEVVAGPAGTGSGYALDGTSICTTNATVVQCVLSNVPVADAWELSKRMDGDTLSAADGATADAKGRVIYSFTTGTGEVYVYMAHK